VHAHQRSRPAAVRVSYPVFSAGCGNARLAEERLTTSQAISCKD
jgi:hypothetical protein